MERIFMGEYDVVDDSDVLELKRMLAIEIKNNYFHFLLFLLT